MSEQNKLPAAVKSLIRHLAYSFYEEYQTPDEQAAFKPDGKGYDGYRFQIFGPEDLYHAMTILLIGRVKDIKDRGPKGFGKSDTELVYKLIQEMQQTGKSKAELLRKYSELAERRDYDTELFSVEERLSGVYDSIQARRKPVSKIDGAMPISVEQLMADGAADEHMRNVMGPLEFLRPWIIENKEGIIKILES